MTHMIRRRTCAGEDDLAAMQRLLHDAPDPFVSYPSVADLAVMLKDNPEQMAANTMLWEDDSRLVGYALVDRFHNLFYHFAPGVLNETIEREMITWAERRLIAMVDGAMAGLTLDAAARDDDTARVAFLARNGFIPTGDETWRMGRSLDTPLPEIDAPPGFVLRSLAGEAEVTAYVAAHRAAYGTEHMTGAHRLAMLRQPGYLPDLDLVAIAPDGTLAAFCICEYALHENRENDRNEGEIAIVGVRPEYRGRGLARALIALGLWRLREHGASGAWLGVSGANTAAIRVYQSLGFETRTVTRWYARAVEEA